MRLISAFALVFLTGVGLVACDSSQTTDAGSRDAAAFDSGARDAGTTDAGLIDAGSIDGGAPDAAPYHCGAFSVDPGWTVQPGFRAVTIATSANGLSQPVALAFAGGVYNNLLFVVDQGNDSLFSLDVRTGIVNRVVTSTAWSLSPLVPTTIAWDELGVFDGALYVGDQGGDGDQDSRIYRVAPDYGTSTFTNAPGPGLDDVFGLAFVPTGTSYTSGLYVSGDTDGAGADWGTFDSAGVGTAFSDVAGIEGIVFDRTGRYGGRLIAARPLGGGYNGDGTITALLPTGTATTVLASGLGGVHAVVIGPGGAFEEDLYAASWSSGQLLRVRPNGVVDVVASGLSLTNYDGNILAFSPDGQVLFVADRAASRVVCIEPVP